MSSGPWALPDELRQLAEAGDESLVQEVLTIFRSDTADRIAKLKAAVQADDRSTVRNQAHALKGSAGQIGANELATVCKQVEADALTAPKTALQQLVRQLESAFAEVVRAMPA